VLCQPFPSSGVLASNLDLDLRVFRDALSGVGSGHIVSYIVRSTEKVDGCHCQRGSGPNWQGGLITLCTCRHDIRSRYDCDLWQGNWIAGFTVVGGYERGNSLVYLMRVQKAFESHVELWNWLPDKTRHAKAAHMNRHGDVFRPRASLNDLRTGQQFEPGTYEPPCDDHPHSLPAKWHKDINKIKRAALLVGDPHFSFVWSKPMLVYSSPDNHPHPRAKGKIGGRTLAEFLSELAVWGSISPVR
jgi:hypothetical protein